ncbi:Na+/H+ antiporter NhaC family protein [Haloimpatiens sp. FM7330]|uniref:Na+/H+ antiporter NhaC family protein n=1 Tax=Haloimpatiens sp. FM7330 TaxID=3298610 RepID=UPI003640C826
MNVLGFIAIFITIIIAMLMNISLVYPLLIGFFILVYMAYKEGYKIKDILKMALHGGKKALILMQIFTLIGAVTAVWMASGTVEFIVFYGIKLIKPDIFLLCAFLITSLTSFLIGTSFGTVGTIGTALMVMAKGGGVSVSAAAGAIIAGAYFGDRCSPMSSVANLISSITETNLYDNVKNMIKTSSIPFMISLIIYYVLSIKNPMIIQGSIIADEIQKNFNIGFLALFPAVILFILVIFKVDVKKSMLASILSGILIALFVQKVPFIKLMKYIIVGYSMDKQYFISTIIKGGGIVSMLVIGIIVFISSAYSGIIEGTKMLENVEQNLDKLSKKVGTFNASFIVGLIVSAAAFSQALAVILHHQLVKKIYIKNKIDDNTLALDLSNTSVLFSGLIPWNMASFVPASMLSAGAAFIPYAFYIYLVPIYRLGISMCRRKTNK